MMDMDNVQREERRAKRFWISLVVGLLGLQLVIGGFAVSVATSDQAPAVLPDYHQSALDWDSTQRTRAAIDQLGWEITVEPSDVVDAGGKRAVRLQVIDGSGSGVDGLKLDARAYHHARGHHVLEFSFESLGEGQYQAVEPMGHAGLWRLQLSTQHAGKPLQSIHTLDLT